MKVRIRHVDGDEYNEELLSLQADCLPADTPIDPAVGEWWIAFDGDAPVGFACMKPSDVLLNAGYLARAGVIPGYRGQGLQKRLINVRVRRAKKYGWDWVRTETRDNPASANSLIACGFRMFSPSYPWAYPDSVYFRKKVAA